MQIRSVSALGEVDEQGHGIGREFSPQIVRVGVAGGENYILRPRKCETRLLELDNERYVGRATTLSRPLPSPSHLLCLRHYSPSCNLSKSPPSPSLFLLLTISPSHLPSALKHLPLFLYLSPSSLRRVFLLSFSPYHSLTPFSLSPSVSFLPSFLPSSHPLFFLL